MKNKKHTQQDEKLKNAPVNEVTNENDPSQTYWDRVADDVAAGYKSKEDENEVLNKNQRSNIKKDEA